jgi:hypothetical protein
VARGEAQPGSDVDFLVEMEAGRSLMDMGGLVMELQDLLGHSVDVVTERGLKNRIRVRVLARGHPSVRDPRERLQDILEAIQNIQRHTSAQQSE